MPNPMSGRCAAVATVGCPSCLVCITLQVAILDEEALLAACAYVNLNPVASGIAEVPEASPHTSIKERVDHVKAEGRTEDLKAASQGSIAGSSAAAGLEESHWLCPIEDRRRIDSTREGMLENFSLGSYLTLVDYTGRLFREGKATISREEAEIFDRLGTNPETWQNRLQRLRGDGCWAASSLPAENG